MMINHSQKDLLTLYICGVFLGWWWWGEGGNLLICTKCFQILKSDELFNV